MFKPSLSVYQSPARTCVSYAEAGINTKLAEDLPIYIFIDLVISPLPNSIYYKVAMKTLLF